MRDDRSGPAGFVLDGVTVRRSSTVVLSAVTAEIPARRCTAVVGPSGSGKSTLLRVLTRLIEPTSGHVLLDGTPIEELDVLALRRRVGLVAQRPVLVTERVDAELRLGCPGLSRSGVLELLSAVGLPASFAGRRTGALSGGEAQRVCLARSLAVEPEVLMLDEPTSALDGVTAAVIAELARARVAAGGTVVFVSHDLGVVRSIADHALVLDRGRLVGAGRPEEVNYLEAR